jgi:hypothetical protein
MSFLNEFSKLIGAIFAATIIVLIVTFFLIKLFVPGA